LARERKREREGERERRSREFREREREREREKEGPGSLFSVNLIVSCPRQGVTKTMKSAGDRGP
jgi:hypothetical protein